MEVNSTSTRYEPDNNASYLNYRNWSYQGKSFLDSMVKSITENHLGNKELISPLILDIINESDLTTHCRKLTSSEFSFFDIFESQNSYSANTDCKNLALRSNAVINKIIEKRKLIFYTSHSDRLVITKMLNFLEEATDFYCSQASKNKCDPLILKLKQINLHLNALKNIILTCESIKRKHLELCGKSIPTFLETVRNVFSKLPSNPKSYLNEILKIKNLYTMNYMEGKLYQEILPEYININKVEMSTSCKYFSSLELMQMAPSLHFIDDPEPTVSKDDLLDVMQVSEFKSVQHLTIRNIMHLYPIISSLSNISSLQHLSIYMNAYQNIRPFHTPLNWIKYLKNLNNLKHIKLNIKTYEPELTKDFIIEYLNMKNVTVELEYIRKPRRLPAYSFTLC